MTAARALSEPATLLRSAWRLLLKSVGGPTLVIGRRWRLPRRRAGVTGAGLPPRLRNLAWRTARTAGLLPWERRDVLHELCSHFSEGLLAGKTEDQLMNSFGDPEAAGRLIGLAKRRTRPFPYRTAVRTVQAAACLGVLCGAAYGALAAWYYTAPPPLPAAWAELRERFRPHIPEEQAAWPLYRAAVMNLPRVPAARLAKLHWADLWPGDPGFEEVRDYLNTAGPSLQLVRDGARRPRVGRTQRDDELNRQFITIGVRNYMPAPPPQLGEDPPLIVQQGTPDSVVHFLAQHLLADARLAIVEGDAERFFADLEAILGMGSQIRAEPRITASVQSSLLFSAALYAAADAARDADFLNDAHLSRLASLLAQLDQRTTPIADLSEERLFFEDLLSRTGTEWGRMTPAGIEGVIATMDSLREQGGIVPAMDLIEWMRELGPAAAARVARRDELLAEFDRLAARAFADAATPQWAWRHHPGDVEFLHVTSDPAWQARYAPVGRIFPKVGEQNVGFAADRTADLLHRRDAITAAIALELHRRRNGDYPATLEALVPGLLPAVPMDRHTGNPIVYGMLDGRPLLYSLGVDRDDDGGRTPDGRYGNERASRLLSARLPGNEPADGDYVLWPRIRYGGEGEPLPVPGRR